MRVLWFLGAGAVLGWLVWGCSGGSGQEGTDVQHGQTQQAQSKEEQVQVSEFGVGPVQEPLNLPVTIDEELAEKGKQIFETMCTSCHQLDERYVGPPLRGVTKRRKPEWIMNMILAPERMIREDPIAKQLVVEYNGAIMSNQGLTFEEARAVLEYFRKVDSEESQT